MGGHYPIASPPGGGWQFYNFKRTYFSIFCNQQNDVKFYKLTTHLLTDNAYVRLHLVSSKHIGVRVRVSVRVRMRVVGIQGSLFQLRRYGILNIFTVNATFISKSLPKIVRCITVFLSKNLLISTDFSTTRTDLIRCCVRMQRAIQNILYRCTSVIQYV